MNRIFYICTVKKLISFNKTPTFKLKQQDLQNWIYECVKEKGAKIKRIDINFVTEDEMLNLNQRHLKHDNHTDIITFSYNDHSIIESEIFISFERAFENAKMFSETFENEILRLISHGLLHIFGKKDSTKALKREMVKEEDKLMRKFHVKHARSEKNL
tara:strand:+ start:49 stop:522 length:474 start_codon:yes stop_codon:yes gene_type:complete